MAGEQTVSGHITWTQQAGSVLQQRKIFRSSLTTRRSHFIWPGGCGQRMDIFPTVRAGYAVMHLSVAPAHTLFHFSDKCNTFLLFSLVPPFLFYILLSFLCLSKLHLLSVLYFFTSFSAYVFVFIPPSSTTFPLNFLIPPFLALFLSLFVVSHT